MLFLTRMLLDLGVGHFQIFQARQVRVQPLAVGLTGRIAHFDFLVVDQTSLHGVDEQHLARMQAFLLDDFLRGYRQRANL